VSIILRVAALLPIPVILGLVIWAGNRPLPPPPVLEQGDHHGASSASKAFKLPDKLGEGWAVQGKVEQYDKKTLFDRIDGAAPAYIRAGFEYSLGAELRKPGMKESVVADIYAMGSAPRALGMYATERDLSYTFIEVGEAGYVASGSLNFWQGPFYVKLAGFEEGEAMDRALKEVAAALAKALPRAKDRGALAPLGWLAEEGRVAHSEGYSYPPLGDVDGLDQVFFASYRASAEGEPFKLFVVRLKDAAEAEQRLGRARAYFEKDGAKVSESKEGEARILEVAGEETRTVLLLKGAVLAGAIDLTDPAMVPVARARLLPTVDRASAGPTKKAAAGGENVGVPGWTQAARGKKAER